MAVASPEATWKRTYSGAHLPVQALGLGLPLWVGDVGGDHAVKLVADVLHQLPPDARIRQVDVGRVDQGAECSRP